MRIIHLRPLSSKQLMLSFLRSEDASEVRAGLMNFLFMGDMQNQFLRSVQLKRSSRPSASTMGSSWTMW